MWLRPRDTAREARGRARNGLPKEGFAEEFHDLMYRRVPLADVRNAGKEGECGELKSQAGGCCSYLASWFYLGSRAME